LTIPTPAAQPHILSYLQARGIEPETASALARYAGQRLSPAQLDDPQALRLCLVDAVQNFISVAPPDFTEDGQQKRIALVGPTGVGKTTTIAKLAAWYMARHHGKLALITIDTYRIAAVEQLKVYGQIMRLPVEVVIGPEQWASCLNKHHDADLILIDTSGHSPQNALAVTELSEFFTAIPAIEKHLVLSATTREHELLHSLQAFDALAVERTIFTKIDECSNLGVLLNVQVHNARPLSFLTNGQRVPEDLLEIDRRKVAELILSEGASNHA
jgi:flagellar biosynthesis protein FlhF